MGERDRSQSYYDRNDNEHRDDQGQRGQRDWNDEVRRSQGRDHNDRNYGQNNSQERNFGQDRNYGQSNSQERNFGYGQSYNQDRNYGQQNLGQDRNYGQDRSFGQDRSYGQNYGQSSGQDRSFGYGLGGRHQDEHDYSQRFNSGGYDARRYPSYSAYDNRNDRDFDQARRHEHESSFARDASQGSSYRPYGGAGRNFQQEQHIGGWYGQDLYRPAQQGNLSRDWNARGEHESRGALRNYGGASNYSYDDYRRSQQDDDGFGQQLRDGARTVARKVKRVFRGPKGYKRSDERVREDVSDRLAEQNQLDPSEIEVQVSNGDVTLTGQVNSRHEKWLAEEIADDVSGVNDVQNQLRVRREQHQSQGTGTGTHTGETTSTQANQNSTEAQRRNARA